MDHTAAVAKLQGQNRERASTSANDYLQRAQPDIALATAMFLRAADLSATDPARAEELRDRAEAIYERLELEYQIVGQNR